MAILKRTVTYFNGRTYTDLDLTRNLAGIITEGVVVSDKSDNDFTVSSYTNGLVKLNIGSAFLGNIYGYYVDYIRESALETIDLTFPTPSPSPRYYLIVLEANRTSAIRDVSIKTIASQVGVEEYPYSSLVKDMENEDIYHLPLYEVKVRHDNAEILELNDVRIFSGARRANTLEGATLSTEDTFSANSDSLIPSQKAIRTYVKNITGVLNNLDTTDKSDLVTAINEVLCDLNDYVGTLGNLDTTDKTNLVSAINEVLQLLIDTAGPLGDLDTTETLNLVLAINEVFGNVGILANLDTVDKTSLVGALNEVLESLGSVVLDIGEVGDLDTTASTLVLAINELKGRIDEKLKLDFSEYSNFDTSNPVNNNVLLISLDDNTTRKMTISQLLNYFSTELGEFNPSGDYSNEGLIAKGAHEDKDGNIINGYHTYEQKNFLFPTDAYPLNDSNDSNKVKFVTYSQLNQALNVYSDAGTRNKVYFEMLKLEGNSVRFDKFIEIRKDTDYVLVLDDVYGYGGSSTPPLFTHLEISGIADQFSFSYDATHDLFYAEFHSGGYSISNFVISGEGVPNWFNNSFPGPKIQLQIGTFQDFIDQGGMSHKEYYIDVGKLPPSQQINNYESLLDSEFRYFDESSNFLKTDGDNLFKLFSSAAVKQTTMSSATLGNHVTTGVLNLVNITTLNIVNNTALSLPIGYEVFVFVTNDDTLNISTGSGVSLTSGETEHRVFGRNHIVRIRKIDTNTWIIDDPNSNYAPVQTTSGSVTVSASNVGKFIRRLGTTNTNVNIPDSTNTSLPVGVELTVLRAGSGEVEFTVGSNVELISEGNKRRISEVNTAATIKKISSDTWVLIGSLKV